MVILNLGLGLSHPRSSVERVWERGALRGGGMGWGRGRWLSLTMCSL